MPHMTSPGPHELISVYQVSLQSPSLTRNSNSPLRPPLDPSGPPDSFHLPLHPFTVPIGPLRPLLAPHVLALTTSTAFSPPDPLWSPLHLSHHLLSPFTTSLPFRPPQASTSPHWPSRPLPPMAPLYPKDPWHPLTTVTSGYA